MYDFYNFYFLYLLISYYPKAIYFCALLLYLALLLSFHCFFLRREHWLFRVFLVMSWISYHLQVDFTFLQIQVTPFSPSVCHEVMGPDTKILVFWMLSFKPAFSLSTFTFIKGLFSFSSLSATKVVSSAYLKLLIFSQQSWFQLVLHTVWPFTWCTLHVS